MGNISFLLSPTSHLIRNFKGSALIVPEGRGFGREFYVTIPCKTPKLAFIFVLHKFFSTISHDVKVGQNTVIGCEGFGHEPDCFGVYTRFPHFGKIRIDSGVEIGCNVIICKGSLPGKDTVISENVRIWHGVNVGHNCYIGKRSVILNNSTLCGSVTIGDDVWVSPGVTIMNKITIGNNSIIGIGSVVTKDVPENDVVAGNPAKRIGSRDEYSHIMRSRR